MSKSASLLATVNSERFDSAVTLLMDASRHWSSFEGEGRLAMALKASREMWNDIQKMLSTGMTSLPVDVKNNLLIVSVYVQGKLLECEQAPTREKLATLISMTRNVASSLGEWRAAA